MRHDYRHFLILLGLLLLGATAALAQGIGLGIGLSDRQAEKGYAATMAPITGCLLVNVGSKLLADVGSCLRVQ